MGVALVMKHVISYCQRRASSTVFAINFAVKKPFNQLYITNNTECFSFKNGCAVHVVKLTKIDWFVVLQYEFRLNTTLYYF